jgi:hypothetical protein
MLVFVKYVARFGLFIALIVLNTGVALLLLGHAKSTENLISISKSAIYGATVLIVVSAIAYFL